MKYELHLLLAADKIEWIGSFALHRAAIGLPINYRATFSKGRSCRLFPARRYTTTTTKLLLIDNLPSSHLLFMPTRNTSIIWRPFIRSYRLDHELKRYIQFPIFPWIDINSHWFINVREIDRYIIYEKISRWFFDVSLRRF